MPRPLGHNLDSTCDDCGDGLCSMCEVLYHTESLCASCVELRLKRRGRQSNGWRGWAAMGLGLAAVGALMAPYTLITDPAAAAKLPGGMLFFGYATVATGALGLGLGAAAQDFVGIGRRAGAAGAVLALLALLGRAGIEPDEDPLRISRLREARAANQKTIRIDEHRADERALWRRGTALLNPLVELRHKLGLGFGVQGGRRPFEGLFKDDVDPRHVLNAVPSSSCCSSPLSGLGTLRWARDESMCGPLRRNRRCLDSLSNKRTALMGGGALLHPHNRATRQWLRW